MPLRRRRGPRGETRPRRLRTPADAGISGGNRALAWLISIPGRGTMKKLLALLLLALPLSAISLDAAAQNTPVGTWTTIDDKTQKPKSVVEIYEAKDGSLAGRVTEVLQSDR